MRSNQLSYTATNEKNLRQAGQNRLDTGPHSEPPTGIDPVTSFLPRTRSTTELGGQRVNTLPEDFATNKSAAQRSPDPEKARESGPESASGEAIRGCQGPLPKPV